MAMAALLSLPAAALFSPKNRIEVSIVLYDAITGRKLRTYLLTSQMITVTCRAADTGMDRVMVRHSLSELECRKLDRFFSGFDLGTVGKQYFNENGGGDSFWVYRISVNRIIKEAYVYSARPPALLQLNGEINRLLPRSQALWDETR